MGYGVLNKRADNSLRQGAMNLAFLRSTNSAPYPFSVCLYAACMRLVSASEIYAAPAVKA